jgi:aromatic-L-amino-acid decarboxylase
MPEPSDQLASGAPALPLIPGPTERASLGHAALEFVERLIAGRAARGPLRPAPRAALEAMLAPPPAHGGSAEVVLVRLLEAAQFGTDKTHPGDLSYVPSAGLYSGAVAALLGAALHAYTGAAMEAPALVALEESVLRWLCDLFGLPADAEGILLSGGSAANQTAVVCARAGRFEPTRSRAYLAAGTHHSVAKALRLSGVPDAQHVIVPARSPGGPIDAAALRRRLAGDVAAGLEPWLVVGTAGSTDTGAVDDLEALADLAAEYRAWFHVDAAYGGMFALTVRGAAALRGLARADSITVDPHKGLSLPWGVGALLVRSPGRLAQAHSGEGGYMRDVPRIEGVPHYFERGPELTRPFRGLLVWLPLQLHGVDAFRRFLDDALDLARDAAARLAAVPGIVVHAEPALSIVAFRAVEGDAATQALLAKLNGSGLVRVSSTVLDGRSWIRLAFLKPNSGPDQVATVLSLVSGPRAP